MKRSLILLPIFAFGVAAQDNSEATARETQDRIKRDFEARAFDKLQVLSAVMGATVKGAPYSALETVENTQTLGDGTHINQSTQTMVYRDSEGRMRRETPDSITIWDPVANTSYELNPKTQTARKMPLGVNTAFGTQKGAGGQVMHFEYRGGVEPSPTVLTLQAPPP